MEYENVITIIIAIVALIISFVSLYRSRKFNEQQLLFQAEADQLTKLQREIIEQQQLKLSHSEISVYIYNAVNGERLGVVNNGNVSVANVSVKLIPKEGYSNPFVEDDFYEKIPISSMLPGDEVNLLLALCDDTGATFNAITSWTTEDGRTHKKEKLLTWSKT